MALKRWIIGALVLIPVLASCQSRGSSLAGAPAMNAAALSARGPRAQAELALGIRLFFDPRLSRTNRVSCGSCHDPKHGFSDAKPVAVGVEARHGTRNTPTIFTAGAAQVLFWDGRAATLEEQALGPIQNAVEMDADLKQLVAELSAIPMYPRLFQAAYGTPVTSDGMARAIAAFERQLQLKESPYDRWLMGDDAAMSASAIRGQNLFSRNHCGECHKGTNLMDNDFHNLGWGLDQPNPDPGRAKITGDPADQGKFKTPTLRNVAQTAPYFHDGRAKTLREVVEFYAKGGNPNPNLDPLIQPIDLSEQDKDDLVAFLEALSAESNFKELAHSTVGQ